LRGSIRRVLARRRTALPRVLLGKAQIRMGKARDPRWKQAA